MLCNVFSPMEHGNKYLVSVWRFGSFCLCWSVRWLPYSSLSKGGDVATNSMVLLRRSSVCVRIRWNILITGGSFQQVHGTVLPLSLFIRKQLQMCWYWMRKVVLSGSWDIDCDNDTVSLSLESGPFQSKWCARKLKGSRREGLFQCLPPVVLSTHTHTCMCLCH